MTCLVKPLVTTIFESLVTFLFKFGSKLNKILATSLKLFLFFFQKKRRLYPKYAIKQLQTRSFTYYIYQEYKTDFISCNQVKVSHVFQARHRKWVVNYSNGFRRNRKKVWQTQKLLLAHPEFSCFRHLSKSKFIFQLIWHFKCVHNNNNVKI